ncbi:ImmA/IrrE family metallo-endopeptidase [Arthrobacter sp. NPDC056691]|uniref:ImmA/IrrE family metallo-endopeptidase n=1 Tax=Arthrobacter sp. NPDC056691 TaxID=3345913 RepID=UPI00366AB279
MMELPDVRPASDWVQLKNLTVAVEYFRAKAAADDQLSGLAEDPIGTLENHSGVSLRYVASAPVGCSVSGYYRPSPPTLNVHRSNSRERDNFTAVHELGHHLQQADKGWALGVLSELSDYERDRLEEAVSDALAVDVLLPSQLLSYHLGDGPLTAEAIATLYGASSASRQACCIAAARHATADKALIILSDWTGKVSLSVSTNESIHRVPTGVVQPDISRLIKEAGEGPLTAAGLAREGLVFSTANRRYDIKFDVALDVEGTWAFSVARPETRYGNQRWGAAVQLCASPSCEAIFEISGSASRCKCGDYKCPDCGACSCESTLPICTECWTELSVADAAANRSIHAYHDE